MELTVLAIIAGLLALVILMLLRLLHDFHHIHRQGIILMLDLAGLTAKIADLKTSVDALIALPSNPAPVDLQPAGDAVDALKAEVDAKLTAPAP